MKTLLIVCSTLWLMEGLPSQRNAQSPSEPTSQSVADDPAAAKAVARKKRFEEEKHRLEGQERTETPPCTDGKLTLYITPAKASMLVGESRGFTLFDTDGKKLTQDAEWSLSSSNLATLTPGPTVTAINEGTFKVTARIDTRTAEAAVKVYPGDKLPIGTAIWEVAPIPCSKTKTRGITKAVQAVPH